MICFFEGVIGEVTGSVTSSLLDGVEGEVDGSGVVDVGVEVEAAGDAGSCLTTTSIGLSGLGSVGLGSGARRLGNIGFGTYWWMYISYSQTPAAEGCIGSVPLGVASCLILPSASSCYDIDFGVANSCGRAPSRWDRRDRG